MIIKLYIETYTDFFDCRLNMMKKKRRHANNDRMDLHTRLHLRAGCAIYYFIVYFVCLFASLSTMIVSQLQRKKVITWTDHLNNFFNQQRVSAVFSINHSSLCSSDFQCCFFVRPFFSKHSMRFPIFSFIAKCKHNPVYD